MRRARVKVAPNLGRKLGRSAPTPAVPAKPVEDAAATSLTSPVAKTNSEAEASPVVGSVVKESLRYGIEQRSRRDSTTTKDIVSPPADSNAPLKSPVTRVTAAKASVKDVTQSNEDTSKDIEASTSSATTSMTALKNPKDKKTDETDAGSIKKPTDTKLEPPKPGLTRRSRFMKAKPNIVESRNRPRLNSVGETSTERRTRLNSVSETSTERRARLNSVGETSTERRARLNSVSDSDAENSKQLTPAAVLSPKPVPVPPAPKTAGAESEVPLEKSVEDEEEDEIEKEKENVKQIQTAERASQEKPEKPKEKGEKKPRKRTKREILDPEYKRQQRKCIMLHEPIDRTKLTIRDLIYMNPSRNPMKKSEKEKKKDNEEIVIKDKEKEAEEDENKDASADDNAEKPPEADENANDVTTIEDDEEEEAMPVPQVTIGADGEIIVNEQSLVIDNPKNKDTTKDMELVQESDTSGKWGYGKTYRCRTWTLSETKKFYLALSTVGTDFTLMARVFPSRTRVELKRKFKREETINRFLIDEAVKERVRFDQDFMDELIALDKADTEERERIEKEKEEKKQRKKERVAKIDEDGVKEKKEKEKSEKKERKPRQRKKKAEQKEEKNEEVNEEEAAENEAQVEGMEGVDDVVATETGETSEKKEPAKKPKKKPQATKRKARGVRGKKSRAKRAKLMYDDSTSDEEDPDLFDVPEAEGEVEVLSADETPELGEIREESNEPFIPHPPESAGTEVSGFLNRIHAKPTRSGRTVRTPKMLGVTEVDQEEEEEEEVSPKIRRKSVKIIESDDESEKEAVNKKDNEDKGESASAEKDGDKTEKESAKTVEKQNTKSKNAAKNKSPKKKGPGQVKKGKKQISKGAEENEESLNLCNAGTNAQSQAPSSTAVSEVMKVSSDSNKELDSEKSKESSIDKVDIAGTSSKSVIDNEALQTSQEESKECEAPSAAANTSFAKELLLNTMTWSEIMDEAKIDGVNVDEISNDQEKMEDVMNSSGASIEKSLSVDVSQESVHTSQNGNAANSEKNTDVSATIESPTKKADSASNAATPSGARASRRRKIAPKLPTGPRVKKGETSTTDIANEPITKPATLDGPNKSTNEASNVSDVNLTDTESHSAINENTRSTTSNVTTATAVATIDSTPKEISNSNDCNDLNKVTDVVNVADRSSEKVNESEKSTNDDVCGNGDVVNDISTNDVVNDDVGTNDDNVTNDDNDESNDVDEQCDDDDANDDDDVVMCDDANYDIEDDDANDDVNDDDDVNDADDDVNDADDDDTANDESMMEVDDAQCHANDDVGKNDDVVDITDDNDDDEEESVIVISPIDAPQNSELSQNDPPNNSATSGFEPGSLVFVTSDPTIDENGVEIPGAIHVYLVSESGDLDDNAVNLGSMPSDSANNSEDLAKLLQNASTGLAGNLNLPISGTSDSEMSDSNELNAKKS